MFSLAIALPIFLLPISLLSLAFLACMWMSGTLTPSLSIYLSLIALSSAAAGAVNLATNASPVLNSALEATLECLCTYFGLLHALSSTSVCSVRSHTLHLPSTGSLQNYILDYIKFPLRPRRSVDCMWYVSLFFLA